MLGKLTIFIASMAITMGLVQLALMAFPAGESEMRAWLVCAAVIAYPFQTYWALKKLVGGL